MKAECNFEDEKMMSMKLNQNRLRTMLSSNNTILRELDYFCEIDAITSQQIYG